jgi:hypothetical protein
MGKRTKTNSKKDILKSHGTIAILELIVTIKMVKFVKGVSLKL